MSTMMVVTCTKCQAWYNMDMTPYMPSEHFDMRSGAVCIANDDDWFITEVPYRNDWYYVY